VRKQQSLPGILAAALAVVSLAARPALAGTDRVGEAPGDRMIALNGRALAGIQSQHFQAAKYWLEEALVISETAGLDRDPLTARTYVHLAAVALVGLHDREAALHYFDLALKINPNVAITPGLNLQGLRSAYLQARQQAGLPPSPDPTAPNLDPFTTGAGSSAFDPSAGDSSPVASDSDSAETDNPASEEPPPPPVREAYAAALLKEPDLPAQAPAPIYCALPIDVPRGQDLVVRCLARAHHSNATFHHRPGNAATPFVDLPMDRSPKGWLVAVVPGDRVVGKSLSYYVTAQTQGNERPIFFGYPESPRSLIIRAEAADWHGEPDATGALISEQPYGSRPHHRRAAGSLWFGLGLGSGVAYHGREPVDSNAKLRGGSTTVLVQEGFSPVSVGQLEPEIGYQATRRLSLSLMARYQDTLEESDESPPPGENRVPTSAFAMYLNARLTFLTLGSFQSYASGGAGFGRSFLAVIEKQCSPNSCVLAHSDTVHGGDTGLLGGFGVLYHVSRSLGLYADVREIVTLPKFMALTEVSLGIAVAMQIGDSSADRMAAANLREIRR